MLSWVFQKNLCHWATKFSQH
jgi:hypothetical protein